MSARAWAVHLLALAALFAARGASAQDTTQPSPKPPASPPARPPPPQAAQPQPDPGAAASAESKLTPTELDALKAQIRTDVEKDLDAKITALREEMQNEVRAAQTSAAASQDWEAEWQEVKPKLQFFQATGYYRLRMDLWKDADLGMPLGSAPDPWLVDAESISNHTLAQASMRLRFEPTLNISEAVRLKAQIDVFDNLVLGSTAEGAFGFGFLPNNPVPGGFLTTTQLAPHDFQDAINVRRVWAEVVTPVGELRFGRMGVNWGLGMYRNDGNCLDCDYGDTVDRILFATRIANHVIAPSLDFSSEGPLNPSPYAPLGQKYDATQVDDIGDLVLTVLRRDTDEEIRKLRISGQNTFINYGLWLSYRSQNFSAVPSSSPRGYDFVRRDAWSVVPDIWFRLLYKKYRLEIEAATIQGHIGHRAVVPNPQPQEDQALSMSQFGAVIQNELKLADDKLSLRLELGYASGDSAPGFGNLPEDPTTHLEGTFQGPQFICVAAQCADSTIDNFRFNRDYRVDLILWREIVATVTDAIYIRPGVVYSLTQGLNLEAAVIFSAAASAKSMPTGQRPLGVEIDGGATYQSDDGFIAGLSYGVLFPLSGLNGLTDPTNAQSTPLNAGTAQVVRGVFGVVY